MIITNEIDLQMVVEEWMGDGFEIDQCIDALEDGNLLESLTWDCELSEDDKQFIVEAIQSDLKDVLNENN